MFQNTRRPSETRDPELEHAVSELMGIGLQPAMVLWIPLRVTLPDRACECLLTLRDSSAGVDQWRVVSGRWTPEEGFFVSSPARPMGKPVAWAYLPPPFDQLIELEGAR